MQYAIALSQVQDGRATIAANLEMLVQWLEDKDADAALRYWAGLAIANAQSPKALKIVKKTLHPPYDPAMRKAVSRALGSWRGKALGTHAIPILVSLLKDKRPDVRAAAVEGLRMTGSDEPAVILPLLEAAKKDPEQQVWRAAVEALRTLSGIFIDVPGGASERDRQTKIRAWEFKWLKKKKLPLPAGKK